MTLVGKTIAGTYEVLAQLGEGAMGTVFEARDVRLGRRVALKVAAQSCAQQLRNEAQALAAVRHPGLVTVHALVEDEGLEVMVMERIFGESLQSKLDADALAHRRMSIAEVVELGEGIADALSAAHRAGVSHRDLKPSNVMLCGERVVLVDFGLVVAETQLTEGVSGSAEYIAPEVLRRKVDRGNGPLVDLYALGVILYELVAGKTPFVASTLDEIFAGHLLAPVPDIDRIDVPVDLLRLIRELLDKDPLERPPGAEAVLWRLREIRAHLADAEALHIFIVDDDESILRVLRKTLLQTLPRIRVTTSTKPVTAVDEIARLHPHLVLIDLNMPEMNGIELAMGIASLPTRPYVVAMSAEATEKDVSVLRSVGVRSFVPKDEGFSRVVSTIVGDLRNPRRSTSPESPTLQR